MKNDTAVYRDIRFPRIVIATSANKLVFHQLHVQDIIGAQIDSTRMYYLGIMGSKLISQKLLK